MTYNFLVSSGLRLGLPIVVAIGWRVAMRRKINCLSLPKRRKLLVLAKSAGNEDVIAAYNDDTPPYSVFFLARGLLKKSGKHFLGDAVTDLEYYPDHIDVDRYKKEYQKHLVAVVFWLRRLFGVSAVLQFNLVFWAEREIAHACRESELSFVTLQKEAMWTQKSWGLRRDFYQKCARQYSGDMIATYNKATAKMLFSAGVVGRQNTVVTGCPRVDYSHQFRENIQRNGDLSRTVLFYLIEEKAGLPRYKDERTGDWHRGVLISDGEACDWSTMIRRVNQAILSLAAERPDIAFVCKGKTGFAGKQAKALVEAFDDSSMPENVEVIAGGVGQEYIRKASVVIGFNTTAVLEAMAAGLPVIVPNIFSEREKEIVGYAHDVNDGAFVPTTEQELKSMIIKHVESGIRYRELTLGQKNALDKLLGNSDGKAGKRLRAFLDKAVYNQL